MPLLKYIWRFPLPLMGETPAKSFDYNVGVQSTAAFNSALALTPHFHYKKAYLSQPQLKKFNSTFLHSIWGWFGTFFISFIAFIIIKYLSLDTEMYPEMRLLSVAARRRAVWVGP